MKRRIIEFLKGSLILVALVMFTACSPTTVPESYDEAAVLKQAESIVTLLAEGNYEAVTAAFREDLAQGLRAADLEAAVKPEMERVGSLLEISEKKTATTKVEDEEYALVVVVAKHENSKATYTITMDETGKLLGLYMK